MTAIAKKSVAILQSSYIPWKGYFDIIHQVDEFILFDSRQYTSGDWRNRNQIKTKDGLQWLSIPVKKKGGSTQNINEVKLVDQKMGRWAKEHWKRIRHSYSKAIYFKEMEEPIGRLYEAASKMERLSEINYSFLKGICEIMGIKTRITWDTDYTQIDGKT